MKKFTFSEMKFCTLLLVFVWLATTNATCTKELVFAKDHLTPPEKIYVKTDKNSAMEALKKTLAKLGYEIISADEERGKIVTGWRPVESSSHYFNLFGSKDFGSSDGAYYQLLADINEEGSQMKLLVATKVKTIVGKLETNKVVERRVLKQVEDYLRPPLIEMSNVGVRNK